MHATPLLSLPGGPAAAATVKRKVFMCRLVGGVACYAAFFFLVPFRGLSYANYTIRDLVGWLVALCTSLLVALVSPQGAGMDFVGGMDVVLLLLGYDENKLKNSEDHTALSAALSAAARQGNRGPSGRVICECSHQWRRSS